MSRFWTVEDVETLSSLAGDLPWPMVQAAFNRSRPPRTVTALRRKADELGLIRRCTGAYITSGAISTITGFSHEKIRRWITSGKIPARRWGQGQPYPYWIRRRDLRAFARANPEVFGGLSESQLVQLLDSEPLAAELVALGLPRQPRAVAVECVETGRRFPSCYAAAKAAFVTPQRMRVVVARGSTANGLHYRRITPLPSVA